LFRCAVKGIVYAIQLLTNLLGKRIMALKMFNEVNATEIKILVNVVLKRQCISF
jgi:hypothetical protein